MLSSLKQQSIDRHVSPLWHIILIISWPVFTLLLSREATSTNFIVFGLTRSDSNSWTTTLDVVLRHSYLEVFEDRRFWTNWWKQGNCWTVILFANKTCFPNYWELWCFVVVSQKRLFSLERIHCNIDIEEAWKRLLDLYDSSQHTIG